MSIEIGTPKPDTIESLQQKVSELEQSNTLLQLQLKQKGESQSREIRRLTEELETVKSSDTLQRKINLFAELFSKRQQVPLKEILKDYDTLICKTLPPGCLQTDIRDDVVSEQISNEMRILEGFLEEFRGIYDEIPHGTFRPSSDALVFDVNNVNASLQASRTRLSYFMKSDEYTKFMMTHIPVLKELIEVLLSRTTGNGKLSLGLTPHEKGLLWYNETEDESYLRCYERGIEIQKRLLASNRYTRGLELFERLPDFEYSHYFCQIEDILRSTLITCKPHNNIVYIPNDSDEKWNCFSFYTFNRQTISTDDTVNRIWKLDARLMHTTRMFIDKYTRGAEVMFRRFYKDVFGHNNYIHNFPALCKDRGIERWKQFSKLYENLQICSDEYLVGEIARRLIKTNATYIPVNGKDVLSGTHEQAGITREFKELQKRWDRGLPAFEDEPENYMYNCFDNCSEWIRGESKDLYYERWSNILK